MNNKHITFGIIALVWFIALAHGYGLILMDGVPGIGMALMTTFWFAVGLVVTLCVEVIHSVVEKFNDRN